MTTMGEVESCHIHSTVKHLAKYWDFPTGRAEGADDLWESNEEPSARVRWEVPIGQI